MTAIAKLDWKHLDELRGYKNPPATVKLVVSCVLLLLDDIKPNQVDDKKSYNLYKNIIGGLTFKDRDFKMHVLHAAPGEWKPKRVAEVRKMALDLNMKRVKRSSTACMPLYLWTTAMLKFREMFMVYPEEKQAKLQLVLKTATQEFFNDVSLQIMLAPRGQDDGKGGGGGGQKKLK